jgi:hypothetical protein
VSLEVIIGVEETGEILGLSPDKKLVEVLKNETTNKN